MPPSQLHPDRKVFGGLGNPGEWRPTNELNKAYVVWEKPQQARGFFGGRAALLGL
jgi:hypothetical protein